MSWKDLEGQTLETLDHDTLVILLVATSSRDTSHNDPPCHESREQLSVFGGSSPLLTTMYSMREPEFHQEEVIHCFKRRLPTAESSKSSFLLPLLCYCVHIFKGYEKSVWLQKLQILFFCKTGNRANDPVRTAEDIIPILEAAHHP